MNSFYIIGGNKLYGETKAVGAKNAVLPILAACVMNRGEIELTRCPDLKDVRTMLDILVRLGADITFEQDRIVVNGRNICGCDLPKELIGNMRSSIFLLGPLLARFGEAKIGHPGGCAIGKRPIDIHIKAFRDLGVEIKEEEDALDCKVKKLIGADVELEFPSVGATENIMMLATACEGVTQIRNAAREPEIVDLQNFLNAMGARISGGGSHTIIIEGKNVINDINYDIIPDRIISGTLLAATAVTGGQLVLRDCIPDHFQEELFLFIKAGCTVKTEKNLVYMKAPERLNAINHIVTGPYPKFPTDMQSQFAAMMCVAHGESKMTETIFENRFQSILELKKMGASIEILNHGENTAVIRGMNYLRGSKVVAKDLRGGAALVIGALAAQGQSIVEDIVHIDRGYEKLEIMLSEVGANICRK